MSSRILRRYGALAHHAFCRSILVAFHVLHWSGATIRRCTYGLVKQEMIPWEQSRAGTGRRRRWMLAVSGFLICGVLYSCWTIVAGTRRLRQFVTAAPVERPAVTTGGERIIPRSIYINGYPNPKPLRDPEGRIVVSKQILKTWKRIKDDTTYAFTYDNDFPIPDECIPIASWENKTSPNCNMLHEIDIPTTTLINGFSYVTSGGSNDVFRLLNPEMMVLKIFSPGRRHRAGIPHTREYYNFHFDVVRRDALVMERLTTSIHVLPVHGHCGFAVVVPWASGGTLGDALEGKDSGGRHSRWHGLSSDTRLTYAVEAAKGLADIHGIGLVHGDLTINQYLITNATLQLSDFNRCVVLRSNHTDQNNTFCTFDVLQQFGKFTAPEVYKNEPKTSAIDVYSLGSIVYHILTGKSVWSCKKCSMDKARDAIVMGQRPHISSKVLNSTDPVDSILMEALDMCYMYNPSQRATAKEVATFLENRQKTLTND